MARRPENDPTLVAGRQVWAVLLRAEPRVVAALGSHGVTGTHHSVGFSIPFTIHVWLLTATDAERDALPAPDPLLAEVREIYEAVGFPHDLATLRGTVVQSQETVDRDYEGSWFYALR